MTNTNWPTIDTAPRNGDDILIWNKEWGMAVLAYWGWKTTEDDDPEHNATFEGWVFNRGEQEDLMLGEVPNFLGFPWDIENGCMPTHWCYPPTTTTEEKE